MFDRAEAGRAIVLIPVIVLAEIFEATARGRLQLDGGFAAWTARLRAHPGYDVVDLTADIVLRSADLMSVPERSDRLIAATALEHDVPLITRDPELNAPGVDVVW